MAIGRIVCALGAALFLLGCYPPTTSHPVGTTTGVDVDPALVGLWRGKMEQSEDARDVYFHFLPTISGGITVVIVQGGPQPDADWSVANVVPGTSGSNHFMNAQLVMSDGKPDTVDPAHGTLPVLYRYDSKGRLLLFLMNEDATKAAIKAGKIAGTVEEGQFGDARITADPVSLDAFMASKQGTALFTESFAVLTKIE